MRQLHPWYAHNISGVLLCHHQAQTPTPALKETTFHQPISATFICPWSFLPWPQKRQLCTRLLRQRLYINARALAFLFQKQSIDSCLKVSLNSLSLLGTIVTVSHKKWEVDTLFPETQVNRNSWDGRAQCQLSQYFPNSRGTQVSAESFYNHITKYSPKKDSAGWY